jgi:hypothetical protein
LEQTVDWLVAERRAALDHDAIDKAVSRWTPEELQERFLVFSQISPGRYQRLDLFIKVIRLLCLTLQTLPRDLRETAAA